MQAYLTQISITLKLTWRDRMALFFNYAFPLIFFFLFAMLFKAEQGGAINQVFSSVLVIGVLGNGLFGGGLRSVQDREANILRRFKVAPITALPMLVASMVTGLLHYLPAGLMLLLLSHFLYGMPIPERWVSLLVFVCLGVLAFRALGLMVAAVVNSMAESQILTQAMYMPMMMLSGAMMPVTLFPIWLQIFANFLPATYLFSGMQGILLRKESLAENLPAAGGLLLTVVLATLLGVKLFRWEKEDKIRGSGKLWLAAVLAPFVLIGGYQAYSRDNITKSKLIYREMRRSRSLLIRDARIFTGDGRIIESGAVLVRKGKIEEIYEGKAPDAKLLNAEPIEAAGKTVVPGLIDVHIHLGAPGGFYEKASDYQEKDALERRLAAYLYCGVTAVRSAGDPVEIVLATHSRIASGEILGAEFFVNGPLFTAEGGHGTEYFKRAPEAVRATLERQFVRIPKTADEARRQVDELKTLGVDGIKVVLESGVAGYLFQRMDIGLARAVAAEAQARKLPLAVHTGDATDVADAVAMGASSIEHGSRRDRIPDEIFARMANQGIAYDPTLSVSEGFADFSAGKLDLLDRSLVQQVGPAALLAATKKMIASPELAGMREGIRRYPMNMALAHDNLRRAHAAGVRLVTGSDAGNPLVLHGPTVHRELQLLVQAGIPPQAALQAATWNAARLLGAENRFGAIRKGLDATLLVIDGNPLHDIAATERISMVLLKGERVARSELFEQE